MKYEEIVLEISDFEKKKIEGVWHGQFKVRVLNSPKGEMSQEQATTVAYDLRELKKQLDLLDARSLDRKGLIALGRTLASLLLPPAEIAPGFSVRGLFAESYRGIDRQEGLRLKLRLPAPLTVLPWEYVYVDRAGGGDGIDGFLALDPQVSIVRHEVLTAPPPQPQVTGDIKVVAALAENPDLPPLDLSKEKSDLQEALKDQQGIDVTYLDDATLDEVQAAIPEAAIFHFAGHGAFNRQMGDEPGTYSGTGVLALSDSLVEAEKMSLNLRGNGISLVVLGGCETGRREGVSVWSGIAPALVKADIPAVVANQYSILDKCAIAFSKHFYQALVGGLPIERAVSAGRIAAFNVDENGRDWGVPVLYLRANDSQLFAGADDAVVREKARTTAMADINMRVATVSKTGRVLGAEVSEILDGKLAVNISVAGTIYGSVVGVSADVVEGDVKVDMDADTVEGEMVGLRAGRFGGQGNQAEVNQKIDDVKGDVTGFVIGDL